jgi:hypothetical protein
MINRIIRSDSGTSGGKGLGSIQLPSPVNLALSVFLVFLAMIVMFPVQSFSYDIEFVSIENLEICWIVLSPH